MREKVPTWLAALVIAVVVVIIAVVYYFTGTIRPKGTAGPTPPEVKAKMQQYLPKLKGQVHGPAMHGYPGHGAFGAHGR